MERLVNCDFIIDIELIEIISGSNQYFEVIFLAKDKKRYKLIFDSVWDMRYSIENGYIDRFYQLRKCLTDELIANSIYRIENSDYIKYFEKQASGTRPIDNLKSYILYDTVDTVMEFLTIKKPTLVMTE